MLRNIERFGRNAAKNSEFTWRYVANLTPTVSYKFKGKPVTGEASGVLAALDRDGIAITSVETLVGARATQELFDEAERLERQCADKLEKARADLRGSAGRTRKPFVVS